MTGVLVGIPWRPQLHRMYAHDLVHDRYRRILPDATVVDVDTDHQPFCLAGCRNKAVRAAEAHGAGIAVLADADTLVEAEPLLAAIQAAAGSHLVHLPYTEYRSLGQAGTSQFLAGRPLEDCDHLVVDGACSGVYVTTPATWWSHGGQDERFLGWGCEDAAWCAAHRCLLGAEPARHDGRVFSLHHESAAKSGDQYTANFALVHRYHQAQGSPDAMWALIGEQEPNPLTSDKSTLATGG